MGKRVLELRLFRQWIAEVFPFLIVAAFAVAGVLSFPWLLVRENRLMPGIGMWLHELSTVAVVAVPAVPAVAAIIHLLGFGSDVTRSWRRGIIMVVAGATLAISLILFSGIATTEIIARGDSRLRISLGLGFWSILLESAVVIYWGNSLLDKRNIRKGTDADSASWAPEQTGQVVKPSGLHPYTTITLLSIGASIAAMMWSGLFDGLSVVREWQTWRERFDVELLRHLEMIVFSFLPAAAIAIPLGYWSADNLRVERPVFLLAGGIQVVPSLALFAILIPLLSGLGLEGLGTTPAVIALCLYSILPLARGTLLGMRSIPQDIREAASGMGMSSAQRFFSVELPLSLPGVLSGMRVALVQAVGLTTIAALVGAGGLGWFVFQGLGQGADDLVMLGALPICILALAADAAMRFLTFLLSPGRFRSNRV